MSNYIFVILTVATLWINKCRLLIDHTFCNRYCTVDIYAPDF